MPNNLGIPMDKLFTAKSHDMIESVWWYTGVWHVYIPGVSDPSAYFVDGVGYWIKAVKPCTLELSGVVMENAPFTPEKYTTVSGWNLMGVTSVNSITSSSYLESLGGTAIKSPVYVWDAKSQVWTRDPATLWPTQGMWLYTTVTTGLAP